MKKRILIVDDEPDLLDCLKEFYSEHFDPIAFNDSTVALKWLSKNVEAVDIISTDYSMPNMNGLMFAQFARELTQVPIIMVTGDAEDPKVKNVAPKIGVTELISKTDLSKIKQIAIKYGKVS